MTEFFTSTVLGQTIKQVRRGSRNLDNPALEPYYRRDRRLPAAEVAQRASDSAVFRKEAGLRPLPVAEAAQQIGDSGSQSLFLTLMQGVGLEREYAEEISTQAPQEGVPELGERTVYAQAKAAAGTALTVKTIREGLRTVDALASRLSTGDNTLHLVEPSQPALADDDSVVQARLDQMWDYVRDLLP
jgi:hypothetical protein